MRKLMTLAITGMLATCVAFPADAAKKRASQAVSAAPSTCTGMKLVCLGSVDRGCRYLGGSNERGFGRGPYCEKQCNYIWEQCMKSGFWEGAVFHRPAERR
jgi:hypothetical protein